MSSRKSVVTGDQSCRRGNDSFPNGTSAGENSHRTVARADERLTGATDVLVHVTDILNCCKVLVSPPYKILCTVYFMKSPVINMYLSSRRLVRIFPVQHQPLSTIGR